MNISKKPGRRQVLMGAALVEIGAGLGLMLSPAALIAMLLGIEPEGAVTVPGRMAGIALLALGLAAWPSCQVGEEKSAMRGLLTYNGLVALDLAWLGARGMGGPLLWPTVMLHAATVLLLAFTHRRASRTLVDPHR
jgi:hypothetical protein